MRNRGFSLVEIVFAAGVLAVAAMALVSGAVTSRSSAHTLDRSTLVFARAQAYVERIMSVPFGSPADGPASASELSELFDDDDVLGTITVHKLKEFGPAQFTMPGTGTPGVWRVVVTDDLDGDGDADDAAAGEGRADLLRIAVIHDGKLAAEVTRFDAVASP